MFCFPFLGSHGICFLALKTKILPSNCPVPSFLGSDCFFSTPKFNIATRIVLEKYIYPACKYGLIIWGVSMAEFPGNIDSFFHRKKILSTKKTSLAELSDLFF